ncbi:tRNA wybutosine-synthesizing protein 3 [Metarhizium anisopliae]
MQRRPHLPGPSQAFVEKKTKILDRLAVPEAEYTDLSPKGTVDKGIRRLIDEINSTDGFVTTSSCAGRVSVFLEGRKAAALSDADAGAGADEQPPAQVAGVGGKGAGGTWLYVSHDPVQGQDWLQTLALEDGEARRTGRLIHFKFEPMILHVLTASLAHAQLLLRSALQAGFRESGAVNLTADSEAAAAPMVAVRSMGLGFESLVGHELEGKRYALVSGSYLRALMDIGNERFSENTRRIERFRGAFRENLARIGADGRQWEDPAARRERMRAEGLRRKATAAEGVVDEENRGRESADDLYVALDFGLA